MPSHAVFDLAAERHVRYSAEPPTGECVGNLGTAGNPTMCHPCQADSLWQTPCALAAMLQSLNGTRILCIDDHADTLEILDYILEMHGGIVRTAATVAEGFQVLRDFAPRVMVADICLPVDGIALMMRVRQLESYQTGFLRAIAVSTHCTERDRRLAIAAGFSRFVEKPFDEVQILNAIHSVLGYGETVAAYP